MMCLADSGRKGLLHFLLFWSIVTFIVLYLICNHICICVVFVSYVYRIYIDSDQWFGIMMFPADSGAKG